MKKKSKPAKQPKFDETALENPNLGRRVLQEVCMGGGAELGADDEPPCGSGDLLQLGEARESSADVEVGDQAAVAENITELLRIC
ncbi:hypothetical protein AAC387_Pa05g1162 [Persea americana]